MSSDNLSEKFECMLIGAKIGIGLHALQEAILASAREQPYSKIAKPLSRKDLLESNIIVELKAAYISAHQCDKDNLILIASNKGFSKAITFLQKGMLDEAASELDTSMATLDIGTAEPEVGLKFK